jgi:hypothetical protein
MSQKAKHTYREGILDFALRKRRLRRQFRQSLGYSGNFDRPLTYQEKVQYRKLYGNHEFYALVADKYRVREYVSQRVGHEYLVPLLGVYDRLTPDVFATLPDRFIIKANHGCKWNRIVWDKSRLDIDATVAYFNRLMDKSYGHLFGEFHYNLIVPHILIEQLLVDGNDVPYEYNFYCYHSDTGFDYAIAIGRPGGNSFVHFDSDWNVLEGELSAGEYENYVDPPSFGEMLRVASILSRDFDFVRVDLYNVAGRVFFGEITVTPAAGFGKIENETRAEARSKMWKLDVDNSLLYRKPRSWSLGAWFGRRS